MIDAVVAAWLTEKGAQMVRAGESNSPQAMFIIISQVAGQIDKFVTPARQASEVISPYQDYCIFRESESNRKEE